MALTFTSDTLPADHKAAIRQMKQQLRAQLGDVQLLFNQLEYGVLHCVTYVKVHTQLAWANFAYPDLIIA